MASIDSIKSNLNDLLIENEGNVKHWDLDPIRVQGKELGLSDKDIHKLMVEVDKSINWDAVRIKKEEKLKKLEELFIHDPLEKEKQAEKVLNLIIEQSANDNIITTSEISTFFNISDSLNQEEQKSALVLNDYIYLNNFIPRVAHSGTSLREILQSTDWVKDQHKYFNLSEDSGLREDFHSTLYSVNKEYKNSIMFPEFNYFFESDGKNIVDIMVTKAEIEPINLKESQGTWLIIIWFVFLLLIIIIIGKSCVYL